MNRYRRARAAVGRSGPNGYIEESDHQGRGAVRTSAFQLVLPAVRQSGSSRQDRVEQLIRDAIADGALVDGDQLPPYRVAVTTSALSANTILNAYRTLIAEGMVRSVPGHGYFVGGQVRYCDFFVHPASAAGSAGRRRPPNT
ncbi:winged helix-turn-helix domain-containing protein [Curtobacterium sp. PhB130]|uniref:GntR family transcriptional regulator n=1 Tax=Curtobacterium sp. PhB130 TaxID=2485178 RepID=UPI000F4C117C